MTVRIRSLVPERTWARPGSTVAVRVELATTAAASCTVRLALLDAADEVVASTRRLRLGAGTSEVRFRVRLPGAARHGYGLRATATSGASVSTATAAVEAIEGWWEAPRHVAHTDFRPGLEAGETVAALRGWHVTVAQAYDWMYRHYRYSAPTEAFVDPLGRIVSHDSVRALVREGHRRGIATLAYGSVYGAEPEYVERHPDERVFDESGEPYSLGGAFYINDLRVGRPWRARLLREYASACRRFGFDGIHMDTYGPPHEAVAADGERIRFDKLYPGLVEEGAATVTATGAGRRVLFNCVEGFPIDAVADSPTAAHYLELWPPDDRYTDIAAWIERARRAGPGKPVVIAAYVPALRAAGDDPVARAAAVETAVLLTSVITASGAFHHVLAEGDRVLVEGYYPAAIRLRAPEARELRAAWQFSARYLHLLSDPAAATLDGPLPQIYDGGGHPVPVSATPVAGSVWARCTSTPSGRVLSLVDLRDQLDDRWTAGRQAPSGNRGWRLEWSGAAELIAMSPWTRAGDAIPLRALRGSVPESSSWALPGFRRWLLIRGAEAE